MTRIIMTSKLRTRNIMTGNIMWSILGQGTSWQATSWEAYLDKAHHDRQHHGTHTWTRNIMTGNIMWSILGQGTSWQHVSTNIMSTSKRKLALNGFCFWSAKFTGAKYFCPKGQCCGAGAGPKWNGSTTLLRGSVGLTVYPGDWKFLLSVYSVVLQGF